MTDNQSRQQNKRSRKLKKKIYKINYLNEELDDVIQTVSEYSQEVRDAISSWCKQNNITSALDDMFPTITEDEILENLSDEDLDAKPKNGKIDPWVKEIYRQIANKTHPDKISQQENLSNVERLTLEKLFIISNAHLEENDGPALYITAVDLGLKLTNIPDNILEHFDDSIESIIKKIEQNRNTHAWHWAESSFHDRVKFIETVNKKYDIVIKEEEIVLFLNDYIK
tara:strand:- start:20 stop:697 length:678 start_codon:yes stop_codon:yes gene_type:complete